jgi:hypothetical protein
MSPGGHRKRLRAITALRGLIALVVIFSVIAHSSCMLICGFTSHCLTGDHSDSHRNAPCCTSNASGFDNSADEHREDKSCCDGDRLLAKASQPASPDLLSDNSPLIVADVEFAHFKSVLPSHEVCARVASNHPPPPLSLTLQQLHTLRI